MIKDMNEFESSCYCCLGGEPTPGIMVHFSGINKYYCPEATEDDYYVVVWLGTVDGERTPHRISLVEPKYIYDSEPLPEYCREKVISIIKENYREAIEVINKDYMGNFDPDAMPNYDLL